MFTLSTFSICFISQWFRRPICDRQFLNNRLDTLHFFSTQLEYVSDVFFFHSVHPLFCPSEPTINELRTSISQVKALSHSFLSLKKGCTELSIYELVLKVYFSIIHCIILLLEHVKLLYCGRDASTCLPESTESA